MTRSDTFFPSLLRRRISDNVNLRFISRQPNFVHATNNIDVLILALHVSSNARLSLTYPGYFNRSFQTSHRTLLSSLSSNILFGDIQRVKGKQQLEQPIWCPLGTNSLPRGRSNCILTYSTN